MAGRNRWRVWIVPALLGVLLQGGCQLPGRSSAPLANSGAEGGGNAFGVEIDSKGRIFSGTNGGKIRGHHYVQGGYYQKGFEKHGPLSNPKQRHNRAILARHSSFE